VKADFESLVTRESTLVEKWTEVQPKLLKIVMDKAATGGPLQLLSRMIKDEFDEGMCGCCNL